MLHNCLCPISLYSSF